MQNLFRHLFVYAESRRLLSPNSTPSLPMRILGAEALSLGYIG